MKRFFYILLFVLLIPGVSSGITVTGIGSSFAGGSADQTASEVLITDANELTDETTIEGWVDELATWAAGLTVGDLWDFDAADLTGSITGVFNFGTTATTTTGDVYRGSDSEIHMYVGGVETFGPIDDTAGNGITNRTISADKHYDDLALKANTADLATVATTNSYDDLDDQPALSGVVWEDKSSAFTAESNHAYTVSADTSFTITLPTAPETPDPIYLDFPYDLDTNTVTIDSGSAKFNFGTNNFKLTSASNGFYGRLSYKDAQCGWRTTHYGYNDYLIETPSATTACSADIGESGAGTMSSQSAGFTWVIKHDLACTAASGAALLNLRTLGCNSSASEVVLLVYADNAGEPGTLIWQSSPKYSDDWGAVGGWDSATVTEELSGDSVWIGFHMEAGIGTAFHYYTTDSPTRTTRYIVNSGTFPDVDATWDTANDTISNYGFLCYLSF